MNVDLFHGEDIEGFSKPKNIRKKAMDYLARREYGQEELVRKLERAGYNYDAVVAEVLKLAEEDLQSDKRFAQSFVQVRISQGKGPVRICHELKKRGISQSLVDSEITASGQDWFALAKEIRERKFGLDPPSDFAHKARQMRFLQYRGFEADQVRFAVSVNGDR